LAPLLRAKFHPHRCNVSPLRGEKPQNWPLSKLNTGRFALRAMLPVITPISGYCVIIWILASHSQCKRCSLLPSDAVWWIYNVNQKILLLRFSKKFSPVAENLFFNQNFTHLLYYYRCICLRWHFTRWLQDHLTKTKNINNKTVKCMFVSMLNDKILFNYL